MAAFNGKYTAAFNAEFVDNCMTWIALGLPWIALGLPGQVPLKTCHSRNTMQGHVLYMAAFDGEFADNCHWHDS
jgi:hypothetical protein